MVSFTVRMEFDPEDRDKVSEMLKAITPPSRKEPGCVTYVPHFVDGLPATVFIYEQYTDEAAVAAHRDSDHFKQYAIGGFYQLMKSREKEDLDALL